MNLSPWGIFAGIVLGVIGTGYFMYGKRAERPVHLICGAILAIYPWFVTNLAALIGIGVALVIAPFAAAWWFGF